MDEELYGQDTDIEDAIDAFMKSTPKDEDDQPLSDDNDAHPEADEAEDEDVTTEEDDDGTADPEDGDDDADDDSDDAEGEGNEGKKPQKAVADDEAEVTVSVDGKDIRVSVKDLKRLYGQEAALTQRSQSLANQRKAIEAQSTYVAQLLQDRYNAAKAKVEKYKDVDLFRASRELEPEEFDALRATKDAAESELQKLEQEGATFLQRVQETRQTLLREQAKESLKEITRTIPQWDDELYGKIRTYAISKGMDRDLVNEIVDPGAIVMMYQAMRYSEAQAAAPKVTKKVAKAPQKVVRKSDKPTDNKSSQLKAKRRTAFESGDVEDVAELFMSAMREQ